MLGLSGYVSETINLEMIKSIWAVDDKYKKTCVVIILKRPNSTSGKDYYILINLNY